MSELPGRPLRRRARAASRALSLVAVLAACGAEPTTATRSPSASPLAAVAAGRAGAADEQRDLATLRAATARFHRYEEAAARYTYLFLDMCMVDGSAENRGGMGLHYVDTQRLDGTVDVAAPEALLYEPGPNGQRRLVGVEYVIPQDAWSGAQPPRLFGRDFKPNAFGLWALHVWVWKDNPSGLYADWNPRVSCEHATAVAAGAHH